MSRIFIFVFAALACISAAPASALAHHHGGFYFGLGAPFFGPFFTPYGYDYYGFGYSGYMMEPSRVVYTTPSPTVTYQIVQPQIVQQAVPATSASAPFTDRAGRTCRTFQSTMNGSALNGTACLQPDGSWRTVGQ